MDDEVKPKVKKTPRNLYYWGLLGFLPNFGFIGGIILLFKGLVKYKDKKLIVIGLGDMLFTIIFWMIVNQSEWVVSSKVEFSKIHLNSLFKSIEFYKLENGVYPDSLKQLQTRDKMLVIQDILQEKQASVNSTNFNYLKVGDKYYLFSSGIDGIPNTLDDIYPEMIKTDSTKFGLITK